MPAEVIETWSWYCPDCRTGKDNLLCEEAYAGEEDHNREYHAAQ